MIGTIPTVCGIYLLRNTVDGKCYVGQSVNIANRWREHLKSMRRGTKTKLYDAMRKHGADAFEIVVLCECAADQLDEREAHWMAEHNSRESGYNISPAGQYGRVMDIAAREAIASKLRGRKMPPEQVEKIRASSTGRAHSPETRAKIAASRLGRKATADSRTKMSDAQKAFHATMTDAQKDEYRSRRTGWVQPDSVREAVSVRFKGKKKSDEQRANMRAARLAVSPEADARRLAALRAARARKREAATSIHGSQA